MARLVIAGVHSGVGKTSVTVAIARALRARGLRVAMFKTGPDYLDPTYHARAAGSTSHNLDGFLMGETGVRETFALGAEGADVALIEGVMGLYDGASPIREEGSTAELAKWLKAPVVLVCDASGMARSVAALVHGYASFEGAPDLRGVICNRVGSRGHFALLCEALGGRYPYVAGLGRQANLSFPERHLGLRTAERDAIGDEVFDAWGRAAEEWLRLDDLLSLARSAPTLDVATIDSPAEVNRCRIGVAHDEAFHFYYAQNLRMLERAGAELVFFSPVHDHALPEVDGLYFGGGYPEVHARALMANHTMRAAVRAFAGPIYAECGGLMFMADAIRTREGERFDMVGLVPGEAAMASSLRAIGYVDVTTTEDTPIGPAGTHFRGHQFRYSDLTLSGDIAQVYGMTRRRDGALLTEGFRRAQLLASYVHAHWASNPRVPEAFVASCVTSRAKSPGG